MIDHRPFASLGSAQHGWLDAKHHFSFADYHDPARLHWGALRVWNDDTIAPGGGFPLHPHANMEIITYGREGAITHQDSLGNKGRTEAGDVQVMSAGSGIRHSEYNLEPGITRIFQIWIVPAETGGAPSWGTQAFPKGLHSGQWVVLASGFADDAATALPIRTQARVLGASLRAGQTLRHDFADPTRVGYLVPARGQLEVNGLRLDCGDGAAIQAEAQLQILALQDAELVLVDSAGPAQC